MRVVVDRRKIAEEEKVQKTQKGELGGAWSSRTTFQAGKCCAFFGLPKGTKRSELAKWMRDTGRGIVGEP